MGVEYEVVFDLQREGFQPDWFAILVPGVGALCAVFFAIKNRRRSAGAIAAIFAALFVAGGAFVFAGDLELYRQIVRQSETGEAQNVEGEVRNFQIGSPGGNIPGSFSVGGHHFNAADNSIAGAGYNHWPWNLDGRCARVVFARDDRLGRNRIIWLGVRNCAGMSSRP